MGERNIIQIKVMQQLGGITIINGHTVPAASFQKIAVTFAQVYQPGKSPEACAEEIKTKWGK